MKVLKPGEEWEHHIQPINKFRDMSKLKHYSIIRKLGQGTFGVVQKATDLRTHRVVALKQLINHSAKEGFPITAMREITILKKLRHTNILEISDMIYEEPKLTNPQDIIHQRGCFYTVSEYMCSDLVGLLENPNVHLEASHIKCFMIQLLQGVKYIHEQMYLHRDIKAANILIGGDGILKIADFGLARLYHGKPPRLNCGPGGGDRAYTALVVTRWYRPPELLLGERKYTTAVDMWGVGCVFGEMFTHKPILVGKTDSHQAQLIFSLVGPPNGINWPKAASLPNKTELNLGLTCKRTLESRFADLMTDDGVDLLSGLLQLDPYKRLNADDALAHEYFKNEPLPLKPHELPSFEECHEIDRERFKQEKERLSTTGAPSSKLPEASKYTDSRAPVGQASQGRGYSNAGYGKNYYGSYENRGRMHHSHSTYPARGRPTGSQRPREPYGSTYSSRHTDSQYSSRPYRDYRDTYDRNGSRRAIAPQATTYSNLRDRSPSRSSSAIRRAADQKPIEETHNHSSADTNTNSVRDNSELKS